MHISLIPWLAIGFIVGAVLVAALLWPRRPRNYDLGSVSDSWLADHVSNGHRS